MAGRLVSGRLLREMKRPIPVFPGFGYGLGLMVIATADTTALVVTSAA